jgi:hypothetical protein
MTATHSKKTFGSATFFTKNSIWTAPEMTAGLCDEKPDTNH